MHVFQVPYLVNAVVCFQNRVKSRLKQHHYSYALASFTFERFCFFEGILQKYKGNKNMYILQTTEVISPKLCFLAEGGLWSSSLVAHHVHVHFIFSFPSLRKLRASALDPGLCSSIMKNGSAFLAENFFFCFQT